MNSIISILLSILISLFPFLSAFIPSESIADRLDIITMTENGSDIVLINEDGETVDEEIFISEDADEETSVSLPEKYDARDDGIVTSVKNQGNSGCCWAFAAVSAAETSMIKNGLADSSADYSEAHLVWFGLRSISRFKNDSARGDGIFSASPFSDGGNWVRSQFALAKWSGVQKEEDFPFDGFPYPEGNYDENSRYDSCAHLQNSQYLEPNDRDGIKQAILDCGSITASYYHSNTFLNKTESDGTCYFQKSTKNTNHTITIVGWDDNYSKDNFKKIPDGDGAWLVKNSWGGSWGDSGYFWLSYYDISLSYFVTFEMESADNYDNINQYDGFGYKGWGFLKGYNRMSMANVFTTNADETIRAVSFHTVQPDIKYSIEIYKDIPRGGLPTDGTFVTSENGYMKNRGYKTVLLSDPFSLPEKSRYSVVITLTAPEGVDACIPLEFPEGYDGAHSRYYSAQKGQSYLTVSRSFDEWEDTCESGYNNVCIKTFSDNNTLNLKVTSDYEISEGILGYVPFGASESDILNQFRNENTFISDGFVYLPDENGETADSLRIAYLGDIDNDGDLDYDDYYLLREFAFGLSEPDERERYSSDFDRNRHINANDLGLLNMILKNGGTI